VNGPGGSEPVPDGLRRRPGPVLPVSFYAGPTLQVARDLLGCYLCRREDEAYTVGRIVEVEAYIGEDDPACHAAAGRTPRTRVLYGRPGRAYVYFTYGMHHLFNCVTERIGYPAAVLVRALRPVAGIRSMRSRRGEGLPRDLARGPARLCRALGIDLRHNEVSLNGPELFICGGGAESWNIRAGPRVGIRRATELPWRFWIDGDPHVTRGSSGGRLPAKGGGADGFDPSGTRT
jgi:DNA-3-methyladenine glycosylase